MLASEKPLQDLDAAGNPQLARLAPSKVEVVEIVDGAKVSVADVKITAAANSHYGFEPGTAQDKAYQSLSFRFDMPDRSIVFTGDTGPSEAVQTLAKGADLLVSEITDPDAELASLKAAHPDIPSLGGPRPQEALRGTTPHCGRRRQARGRRRRGQHRDHAQRLRLDRVSEANHDLNRLLDKPGDVGMVVYLARV